MPCATKTVVNSAKVGQVGSEVPKFAERFAAYRHYRLEGWVVPLLLECLSRGGVAGTARLSEVRCRLAAV